MVTCKDCKYYLPGQVKHELGGECRRNPPVLIQVMGRWESTYPETDGSGWCGEFESAEHSGFKQNVVKK